MNKKGMLYKRTFSAAASALMAISAIAPMSVFADEFTEETSGFDIVNEEAQIASDVYLNTSFNDNIKSVQEGFSEATNAEDGEAAKTAIKKILDNVNQGNVYVAIRTSMANMIENYPGSTKNITFSDGSKGRTFDGIMALNIDLGRLLGLSGGDKTFISTAQNGLNSLYKNKYINHDLMNMALNGFIKFNVELPKEAKFNLSKTGASYPSGLVKRVKIEPNGDHKVSVSLELDKTKTLSALTNVVLRGKGDTVKIELPYEGAYGFVGSNNNQIPELNATVEVDRSTDMFSVTGVANRNLHIKANQDEYNTVPRVNILKRVNSVIKDEEEKPQKPSGTLTGGYPSSKPGSSNSSSVVRAMHRLYNPKTGEHFYTQSAEERDNLVRGGWNNEGIGWHAPAGSSTPVYRVFNPNSGDHHYTTNLEEYQTLTRIGWNAEGIGWYSESDKGAPIYRLYNKKIKVGSHHYTQNPAERDKLVNEGWVYEGIAWYAMK